jgi:uncharacterized protein YcfL
MRYLFILILASFLLIGCSASDDLKSCSIRAAKIIIEATDRIKTTKSENVIKDGKIVGTEVYMDTTESKKYLESKNKILQENYKNIEKVYLSKSDQSFDALCVLAVLNEYTFFLSMDAIDDPCDYAIKLNELKTDKSLSDWVLDAFFQQISNPPWFQDSNWPKMNKNEKYGRMVESLMVPCAKK